ncbi:HAD family hydrolase, partial [Ancrocorticia populi]|uniref:HAD family hydrolase n=1 Tax=Ancrocorticia populi TaxID=2175228 RepID=UPI003F9E0CB8
NAKSREAVTHRARDRFPERRIVVIGDTPLDGQAANEAGLDFLGVTTGLYGAEDLTGAGAFLVIEDLVSGLDELGEALS